MQSITFDVELIPERDGIAVVFKVRTSTDPRAVARLLSSLLHAFAVAEHKTLEEMENCLGAMMTVIPRPSGTEIQLRRACSDPAYFDRFDEALCRQAHRLH